MNFSERIPAWPRFDASDEENIKDVLHSRKWWRGNGVVGNAFEEAFARHLGVSHVRAVANGTLALELALDALGVEPGDEVIVPACTFISTASAVLRVGAWPVPVDVERHTLNIDVKAAEAAITSRTACIIPVHMAGHAVDMPALIDLARRHQIPILEDAAHAHGARAFGAALGAIGDASIFSFQSGKLMTCGEGGAVATKNAAIAERTFALHSCGRPQGDTDYVHLMAATNMRLTEFQSALLKGQLSRLTEQREQREQMAPFFESRLREAGLEPLSRKPYVEVHGRYMTMAWFDPDDFGGRDAGALSAELRGIGIPAYRCFPEIHRTAMFAAEALSKPHRSNRAAPPYSQIHTPVSASAAREVIWFQHPLLLGDEDLLADVAAAVGSLRRGKGQVSMASTRLAPTATE
ncbi:DegT/DnrJ/EryC1/StrS family aminotransferase [Bradyrhizobium diazoefficiens]|uniref:DegT/DnrJ/EryC1/StrS family aminotransferase n=1 Tax=Bradyrhizobium diazoefficiens TaxID=1355477 RepID=UPI001B8C7316|nr:DegT/DnrJ/EryC1/StrS family aminotransferase [Bradyrhizobium diazoefficiens]MBR0865895.1 DegT/DnrJ/EryC1/StrS family aminotransferase [Bradyrhizobium diazoefficiens]MBR0890425.1 DegT/DnrJ/EryC1/StrS family aminotransferase [Bradyrhizobium diazoefficiens]MBR0922195.1 DegT/DnrJ/EryC1/StrS family aminotransferase [Bradyrhizobium diazoefficiens]